MQIWMLSREATGRVSVDPRMTATTARCQQRAGDARTVRRLHFFSFPRRWLEAKGEEEPTCAADRWRRSNRNAASATLGINFCVGLKALTASDRTPGRARAAVRGPCRCSHGGVDLLGSHRLPLTQPTG